ncbi:unnamed protein product [Caenorhabditis bovis]|uniref:Serpentine Receptor, class H n=1 Tax=Caenorhabditis bovis TaxID=2654633 RepID=A0A8S1E8K5_9PELO|nr:unnamed protein product [Caenorhabditis bovis]
MSFFPEVSLLDRSVDDWLELLYDDRPMCAISPPFVYDVGITFAHFISLPVYFTAMWCLLAQKSPHFKQYRKYLMFHAICNLAFESHMSIIMKPVIYLPYPVVRFCGAWKFRFVNGGLILFVFIGIVGATGFSIFEMYFYRFQLLARSNLCQWLSKISNYCVISRYLIIIILFISAICLCFCVNGVFLQKDFKKNLKLVETHKEILCTSAMTLPSLSVNGIKPIHVFNFFALLAILFGAAVCFLAGLSSLLAIQEMIFKTKISPKTLEMHRMFLYSLFAQVIVHGIMLGFPVFIYVIVLTFYSEANTVGYFAIIIASTHGCISTIVLMIFTKPLRIMFRRFLQLLFETKNLLSAASQSQVVALQDN